MAFPKSPDVGGLRECFKSPWEMEADRFLSNLVKKGIGVRYIDPARLYANVSRPWINRRQLRKRLKRRISGR